jgi:mono/diheme cytochrome c family protein
MMEEPPPPLQGEATPPPAPAEDPLKPTYTNIRKEIFEPKCASCHFAGGDAQFLRLDSLTAIRMYPNFVLKDPTDSVLIKSVTRKDVGRMPPPRSGPRLSKEEIEMLKAWIVAGAPE